MKFKNAIQHLKNYLKNIYRYYFPLIFYRSRTLSGIYYFLFSKSFNREHQSVLEGKVVHMREIIKNKSNYFLVVRNTHRIEKGLLMRPRRNVFAKGYITETIDNLEAVLKVNKNVYNAQLNWFIEVLTEYFGKSGNDELIDKERDRFNKIINQCEINDTSENKLKPYYRESFKDDIPTYQSILSLSKYRRSVRWFLNKDVPRELLDKALEVANQSPSACNRQPFKFYIYDDKKLIEKLVDLPMGTRGYAQNIPVFIIIVGNLDAYFDERDRHLIYIDASLASMSFMLALETLGLSSCPINWADIENREKKMQKLLNLKNYQRPVMCMAVGYPDQDGMVASSIKKPIEYIRTFNHVN